MAVRRFPQIGREHRARKRHGRRDRRRGLVSRGERTSAHGLGGGPGVRVAGALAAAFGGGSPGPVSTRISLLARSRVPAEDRLPSYSAARTPSRSARKSSGAYLRLHSESPKPRASGATMRKFVAMAGPNRSHTCAFSGAGCQQHQRRRLGPATLEVVEAQAVDADGPRADVRPASLGRRPVRGPTCAEHERQREQSQHLAPAPTGRGSKGQGVCWHSCPCLPAWSQVRMF